MLVSNTHFLLNIFGGKKLLSKPDLKKQGKSKLYLVLSAQEGIQSKRGDPLDVFFTKALMTIMLKGKDVFSQEGATTQKMESIGNFTIAFGDYSGRGKGVLVFPQG